MTKVSWILADADQNLLEGDLSLTSTELGAKGGNLRVRSFLLRGGLRDGVHVVEIDNGALRFHVLPTRGMGVWKAWLGKLELGWRSPVRGPVHPQFVPLAEPSGLGWLDGFDELICRCGLESNGAPEFDEQGKLRYPLHGRIANRPAHHVSLSVDSDSKRISLTGVVDETRFHFQKLRLTSTIETMHGEHGFRIVDEVTNLSGNPAEMQLLYHCNFGQPLLEPGARIVTAAAAIAPRDAGAAEAIDAWAVLADERPGSGEQVYFLDLAADAEGRAHVLLKNARGVEGVSLHFPKRQLPHFIVWKNTPAGVDGYVTGLEPATNLPNPRSFEAKQGRVVKLAPGARARFELELKVHVDRGAVAVVEQEIDHLSTAGKTTVHRLPQKGWSPGA